MPQYTAHCAECGRYESYVRTVATRTDTPACHGPMSKVLDAPMVSAGIWTGHKGFVSHGRDGKAKWIESAQDQAKFMKQNDYVPHTEGQQEATYQKAERVKADDRKLDAAVTKAVLTHNS